MIDILKKIQNFEYGRRNMLNQLYEYYIGKQAILGTAKKPGKPNNKLVTNYAKNIVSNTVGYYLGIPVTYRSEDGMLMEQISDITKYNDDAFHNTQLGKDISIFGSAAEVLYIDDDLKIRYAKINPMNLYVGYTNDLERRIAYAIRWYDVFDDDGKRTRYIEHYTDTDITHYIYTGTLAETGRTPHYFGQVPVNVYQNNEDCFGDYEDILSLMDAYNVMQSESVNDFQKFADALLAVKNTTVTDDVARRLRDENILELDEDAFAEFLVKNPNDAYVENIKNRIEKDIYMSSSTVNLADENFANNASGVAIGYKLFCMENRVSCTERYFKKALQRRMELICNMLNFKGANYDYTGIDITFSRNIPKNMQETATIVQQLTGIVSKETLLAQLPFVEDVQKEMAAIENETNGYRDDFMNGGEADDGGGILAKTD